MERMERFERIEFKITVQFAGPRARVMHEAKISFSAKKHGWWLFVLVVSISPVLGDRFCFGWRFCQSPTRELWEKKEQFLASQRKQAGRRVQESSV